MFNTKYIFGVLVTPLLIIGCTSTDSTSDSIEKNSDSENNLIVGRWKLEKEVLTSSKQEIIEYKNQPSAVLLNVQKNGYYMLYDSIVDPSWKKKGLPLIQVRSKGQWELEGTEFSMNQQSAENNDSESFEVMALTKSELVTKGTKKKSAVTRTYSRKN